MFRDRNVAAGVSVGRCFSVSVFQLKSERISRFAPTLSLRYYRPTETPKHRNTGPQATETPLPGTSHSHENQRRSQRRRYSLWARRYLTEMRTLRLAPWVSEQTTRWVPLLRGQKIVPPDFEVPR